MSLVSLCALCAGLGVALLLPGTGSPHRSGVRRGPNGEATGRRRRLALAALAGAAPVWLLDGVISVGAAVVIAALTWHVLGRQEPRQAAEARSRASRDLPYLVLLMSSGLRAGAAPGPALARACGALPGPAADRLRPAIARLAVGVMPTQVWSEVATDPVLAPLGAALNRSADSGASVVETVERLADDLAAEARAGVEDRARTVGVRAALPLGLCLLPAFLLLGIVPLVASMLNGLVT